MLSEDQKKEIIKAAGTFKIETTILTDSQTIDQLDIADVPWTTKKIIQYDLNQ